MIELKKFLESSDECLRPSLCRGLMRGSWNSDRFDAIKCAYIFDKWYYL